MPTKRVIVEKATRLYQLPPEVTTFADVHRRPSLIKKSPILDLARFRWTVARQAFHSDADPFRPATESSLDQLRRDLAGWYARTQSVRLDPDREIYLGGSISSLVLSLSLAFIDPGDLAFVPELGLPLYRRAVAVSGGEPVTYTVSAKDGWVPRFERISTRLGRFARLLFLNTPHNPTGAELSDADINTLLWLAGRENLLVINDAAYQSMSGQPSRSVLCPKGGRRIAVEVGSFSYNLGLPPLPFGYVVGNRDAIGGLKVAEHIQRPFICESWVNMASEAIRLYPNQALTTITAEIAQARGETELLTKKLSAQIVGKGTVPYLWLRTRERSAARRTAEMLYRRYRILVLPGGGFGETGHGHLRVSLTAGAAAIREATERLTVPRLGPPAKEAE